MADYNKEIYADLLAEAQPGLIASDKECDRVNELIRNLQVEHATERSPEKLRLLTLLVALVTEYETREFPLVVDRDPDQPYRG